jgi:hypothetical protein
LRVSFGALIDLQQDAPDAIDGVRPVGLRESLDAAEHERAPRG